MTKKELEIRCEVMKESLNRINELCEEFTDLDAIMTHCDPDFLEKRISWKM